MNIFVHDSRVIFQGKVSMVAMKRAGWLLKMMYTNVNLYSALS